MKGNPTVFELIKRFKDYFDPSTVELITTKGVITISNPSDAKEIVPYATYIVIAFNYSTISNKLKITCKEGINNGET